MRRLLIALLLVGGFFYFPTTTAAASSALLEVRDARVQYRFGEEITFEAQIVTDQPVEEVYLSFNTGSEETVLIQLEADTNGQIRYTYNPDKRPIRPFTRIYYWFRIVQSGGLETTSPSFYFDYEDNRFAWQTLVNGDLEVYWVEGDAFFGQSALNTARQSLESSRDLVPTAPPTPLKIYIYPSAADLQSALKLGGQALVAGYASPDLGAVMVSLAPGPEQKLEMERQIPHELAHILIYQATSPNYSRIPSWLIEGMASSAELTINPDYERAIQAARQKGTLLPIASLCGSFPSDAPGNFLAYAQSASFVRFLGKQHGTPGLQGLLQAYSSGLGCDEGVRSTLGVPLSTLESRWRQEALGLGAGQAAMTNLLPYLVLLALILAVPLALILFHQAAPPPDPAQS